MPREVGFDEWDEPGRSELYSFYNVMCVDWVDGVRDRKALGSVVERVWDQVANQGADVVWDELHKV